MNIILTIRLWVTDRGKKIKPEIGRVIYEYSLVNRKLCLSNNQDQVRIAVLIFPLMYRQFFRRQKRLWQNDVFICERRYWMFLTHFAGDAATFVLRRFYWDAASFCLRRFNCNGSIFSLWRFNCDAATFMLRRFPFDVATFTRRWRWTSSPTSKTTNRHWKRSSASKWRKKKFLIASKKKFSSSPLTIDKANICFSKFDRIGKNTLVTDGETWLEHCNFKIL